MGMALAEWDREHRLYVGSLNFPCKFLSLLQLYFMKHLLCSKHCRKSRGGVARLYGVEVRDFLAGRKHTGVMMSGVSLLGSNPGSVILPRQINLFMLQFSHQ